MTLPDPYYDRDGITIYCADCMDVLPHLPKVDLVLTDPPYGVGFKYESFVDDDASWRHVLEVLRYLVVNHTSAVCMSFARLWEMPPARWAACWFKPGSVRRSRAGGWSTWEPVLLYGNRWKIANDTLRLPDCTNHTPEAAGHPCPKPLQLFKWLISGRDDVGTVLDPFMGSGTTLVAARDMGCKAIGIEIEEKYCEIAVKRLAQGVLF